MDVTRISECTSECTSERTGARPIGNVGVKRSALATALLFGALAAVCGHAQPEERDSYVRVELPELGHGRTHVLHPCPNTFRADCHLAGKGSRSARIPFRLSYAMDENVEVDLVDLDAGLDRTRLAMRLLHDLVSIEAGAGAIGFSVSVDEHRRSYDGAGLLIGYIVTAPLLSGEHYLHLAPEWRSPQGEPVPVETDSEQSHRRAFRPDPLPRVLAVDLVPLGEEAALRVELSEDVRVEKALQALRVTLLEDDSPLPLALVEQGDDPGYASVDGWSAFAVSLPTRRGENDEDFGALRVFMGLDVGARSGEELDGRYTGAPGSGPFELTLSPEEGQARSWKRAEF